MSTTLLFGDSFTAGRYGIAYTRYLPISKEVRGIDGDTLGGIVQRACAAVVHRLVPARAIVIQGGANDLLIPALSRRDQRWAALGKHLGTHGFAPLEDVGLFTERLSGQLDRLWAVAKGNRIIVCSIPPLGENVHSCLNQRRAEMNEQVHRVTLARGFTWCDIASAMESAINPPGCDYLVPTPESLEEDARFIARDETKATALSMSRNLAVTVDGIHPNAAGARIIAHSIMLGLL